MYGLCYKFHMFPQDLLLQCLVVQARNNPCELCIPWNLLYFRFLQLNYFRDKSCGARAADINGPTEITPRIESMRVWTYHQWIPIGFYRVPIVTLECSHRSGEFWAMIEESKTRDNGSTIQIHWSAFNWEGFWVPLLIFVASVFNWILVACRHRIWVIGILAGCRHIWEGFRLLERIFGISGKDFGCLPEDFGCLPAYFVCMPAYFVWLTGTDWRCCELVAPDCCSLAPRRSLPVRTRDRVRRRRENGLLLLLLVLLLLLLPLLLLTPLDNLTRS